MRRVILASAAVLVLAIASVVGTGALLPVGHTASVERTLAAPPAVVWALVTDPSGFPAWRADVERVRVLAPGPSGPSGWVEYAGRDSLALQVVEIAPPGRLVTRIADPSLPFGGTWTYELVADGPGTRLRITEDGEVYNPVFRFVARFVLGHTATLESYLQALEDRLARTGG